MQGRDNRVSRVPAPTSAPAPAAPRASSGAANPAAEAVQETRALVRRIIEDVQQASRRRDEALASLATVEGQRSQTLAQLAVALEAARALRAEMDQLRSEVREWSTIIASLGAMPPAPPSAAPSGVSAPRVAAAVPGRPTSFFSIVAEQAPEGAAQFRVTGPFSFSTLLVFRESVRKRLAPAEVEVLPSSAGGRVSVLVSPAEPEAALQALLDLPDFPLARGS